MLSVNKKSKKKNTLFLHLLSFASGQRQQTNKILKKRRERARIPGEMQRVRNCIIVLHQVLLIIRRGPGGGAVLMLPQWPCLQTRVSADRLSRVRREAAYNNNYTARLYVGGCTEAERLCCTFRPPPLHNWMLAWFTGPVSGEPYFMHGRIVDRFYIALFSAVEQTHCARMWFYTTGVCVCVCACVRACVRACVYGVCVCERVRGRQRRREREREKLQKSVSSKKRNKRQKLQKKKSASSPHASVWTDPNPRHSESTV